MYPKGTIYESSKALSHGEVVLHAPLKTKLLYALLRGLGAGLIGFALIAILFSYGPIVKEEISYRLGFNKIKVQDEPNLVNVAEAQRIKAVQEEAASLNVNSYFSLVIPKIGAKSNVIANVDPGNETEYKQALSEGVAHAKGTFFPGQGHTIFLFSHSTDAPWNIARYNAVFYLLRELEVGDRIIVFFADHKYEYVVEKKFVTSPSDVSWLKDDGTQGMGERLILQTCDPPGTSWNRLLVVARPVVS